MMLFIALASLGLTSVGALISMVLIQRETGAALTRQVEQNLRDIVVHKANLVDSELGKFAACVRTLANFLHDLYTDPGAIEKRNILPPHIENANIYAMQRSLAGPNISLEDIREQMFLLGNTEVMWRPVMTENEGVVTTIYLGTETGLLLSYDSQSQIALPDRGDTETYYDYRKSTWYQKAKETQSICFTEVYRDVFGRGLTITCAAPFYDAEGTFAGVVAMDILISDLYNAVLQLDIEGGAYAFLADRQGNLIGPSGISDTRTIRNLYYNETQDIGDIAGRILLGKTGVSLSPKGTYYAYTLIDITKWKYCICIPEAQILAPVRSVRRNIIIMMLLFLAAGIWIIALIARGSSTLSERLTGPIAALRQDVEKISEGNLSYRAEVYDNDEIGDLAEGFNIMADSLRDYVKNLSEVTAERERLGAELDIATRIQADLLPRLFPPFPERREFDIFATMTPAKEVGGDFYDFFFIDDDKLALVIADVSGKGVPAALFMAIAKTLIKTRSQMGGTPSEILNDVNNQLCRENSSELFVTVWLGILDLPTGKIISTNAGHEYPVLKREGGGYRLMKLGSHPAVATMGGLSFRDDKFSLRPGDCLFLYTDGVTDAVCPSSENTSASDSDKELDDLFGINRMIKALNRHGEEPVEKLLASMKEEIDDFVGNAPQFDDITMLALQYYGEGGKPLDEDSQKEKIIEESVGRGGRLTVEARTEMLDEALAFIDKYLEAYGCSPRSQMHIDMAAEEIFVNIASYAYTPRIGTAQISLEIETEDTPGGQVDTAVITFTDGGFAYNPLDKPDPDVTLPAGERPIGGLGIYIVKKTMDTVTYEYKDGKNILRMRKRLDEKGE